MMSGIWRMGGDIMEQNIYVFIVEARSWVHDESLLRVFLLCYLFEMFHKFQVYTKFV